MSKSETIRRLRLGDLQKVLRNHYGHTLPDDDAGREDLVELLLPISLGPEGERKMANTVEIYAPWLSADETGQLIDQINRTPAYQRKRTARELGDKLRVTSREREILKLKTIKPCDLTDKELKERRKARDRAGARRRRRAKGSKPRDVYLAKALTKIKPWEVEGISRRTWYRKRRETGAKQKSNGTGASAKQECHGTSASSIKLT